MGGNMQEELVETKTHLFYLGEDARLAQYRSPLIGGIQSIRGSMELANAILEDPIIGDTVRGRLFIEGEGKPATVKLHCDICEQRDPSSRFDFRLWKLPETNQELVHE
jgi:hypothetical protein